MGDSEDGLSSMARAMRAAAPYLGAVWQLVGTGGLGVAVGIGVDHQWATRPWGVGIGAVLGNALGMYFFLRTILKLMEKH